LGGSSGCTGPLSRARRYSATAPSEMTILPLPGPTRECRSCRAAQIELANLTAGGVAVVHGGLFPLSRSRASLSRDPLLP
jgi:hypothetical protein